MRGSELAELAAFVAIAEERSFRRAAARLGLMPSTVSHSLRDLETRLGVRLLNRTTRSVAVTEAGERLLATLGPAFGDIARAIGTVDDFREHPAGTVRLSAPRIVAAGVLGPVLGPFHRRFPDVMLEIAAEDGFVDIVERRFDAGIRLGEDVGRDMIAVRITPEFRIAVVGSPAYFDGRPRTELPQDLAGHRCVGYRQVAGGALYRWEFARGGTACAVPVAGPLVLDDAALMAVAALDGVGLAYVPETLVAAPLAEGRLLRVLEDWCPPLSGFFLYYPGRRQVSAALRAVIDMLRC